MLKLTGKYLRAGVMVKGRRLGTPLGVPQGGPLSPLLANILLDDLDRELEKRGHRFVRYADDFIIMVKSLSAGQRVMDSIRRFLERELRLKVNEKKSKVGPVDEDSLSGFGLITLMKRPVRSRTQGVVGAGGEKPPATRLTVFSIVFYVLFYKPYFYLFSQLL